MKNLFLLALLLLSFACTNNELKQENLTLEEETTTLEGRGCGTMEVFDEQMANNPEFAHNIQVIEEQASNFDITKLRLVNGQIEIPVVVHVIYRTNAENISDAQVQSQIDVLNEDFNLQNSDASLIPSVFSGVAANVGLNFKLDAITRTYSSKRSWRPNDDMKKASKGGVDPWDPSQYLNMWVVNSIKSGRSTILGYAQFPGGPAATDGVVIGYNFFGRVGTLSAPYDLGRTTTHEVGHWLNLRHIWGDGGCGVDDFVADTPISDGPNYGCPSFPTVRCSSTDMTMNYMDYVNDGCMYMFSNGQKDRMLSLFAPGGFREGMAI
ncbi:zinc metalloprotease [Persicobacter diffluens]|uniref:Zinc metalloprotease n=1 Tax=Persicobacter diffluens TaxID=981 RepID=A0AAN4W1E8_9BACT|nr:zinc metalloprotease [Persicobacter diffluens]